MSLETLIDRLDGVKETGSLARDNNVRIREFTKPEFNWLKRIESILRNGLPTDDKAEASTIAHAHAEIEFLLESIDPDWWLT